MSAKTAAALAGAAAGLFWLNAARDARWSKAELNWTPVARKDLIQGVRALGAVEALNLATVKAEVNEYVTERKAQEGQAVKKDQVLLTLTQTGTRLEHDQKASSLANAVHELAKAKKELTIQRNLFAKQAVAFKNVEDAQNALERAKTSHNLAEQEMALARKKLEGTNVRSPIDGVILKDMTLGKDRVRADQELFLVGDVSSFLVRVKVDELDIPQVKPGQRAWLEVDAFPGKKVAGQVLSISPQAERQNFAKVDVLIKILETDGVALKHNLSVQSTIRSAEIPNALAVPIESVRREDGKSSVLVLDRRGRLRRRAVKLGRLTQKEVEVLEGIEEGEQVGVPSKPKARGEEEGGSGGVIASKAVSISDD